jgi:hypothetical protein
MANFGSGKVAFRTTVEQIVYNAEPRAAGTYYSTMVDLRRANRALFYVENTLDVPVTAQAIGNRVDSTALAANIDGPTAVGATTGRVSLGLSDVYWHPYVGIEIVIAGAPTSGVLTIYSVTQE